jgi:Cu(I)/Ag(I) efflux system membrane fusion protein
VAEVRRIDASSSFEAVGTVQFDERLSAAVQTRVSGYVEHLAVRAPMERVRKGQDLATLFAPEWLGPQNELLALLQTGASPELVSAARDRLRAMSIPDTLVRQSEASGAAQARFTLTAPVSGVVAELGVREGVAVTPGMTLFRIAGLDKVWAVAEVPEAQLGRLSRGQPVKATLQANVTQTFEGRLQELLPVVSPGSRTLQARFEVDNPVGRLIPGMLLRLQLVGPSSSRLVVPAEAVIRTGQRALVLVRGQSGSFESRELILGPEIGEDIAVIQGLQAGEQVVASGQFLIDSEARLRSVVSTLTAPAAPGASPAASMPATTAPGLFVGVGQVDAVGATDITITHGPIASLKWPSMTMAFGKPDAKAFAGIRSGDMVRFEFRQGGPTDWELVSVQRIGGAR